MSRGHLDLQGGQGLQLSRQLVLTAPAEWLEQNRSQPHWQATRFSQTTKPNATHLDAAPMRAWFVRDCFATILLTGLTLPMWQQNLSRTCFALYVQKGSGGQAICSQRTSRSLKIAHKSVDGGYTVCDNVPTLDRTHTGSKTMTTINNDNWQEHYPDLRYANLRGCDLSGAPLLYADMRGCDLSGCDLSGADLSGCNLRDATLRYANLSGCDLRYADMRRCDLRDADLRGCDLSNATLSNANLCGCDLRGATIIDGWTLIRQGLNDD